MKKTFGFKLTYFTEYCAPENYSKLYEENVSFELNFIFKLFYQQSFPGVANDFEMSMVFALSTSKHLFLEMDHTMKKVVANC